MKINTIYAAFQGEQNYWGIGTPCIFIRTQGCHIRCYKKTYNTLCDTPKALSFEGGEDLNFEEVYQRCQQWPDIDVICLTGGDPLFSMMKTNDKFVDFAKFFIQRGYKISVETSGIDYFEEEVFYSAISQYVSFVYDFKSPSAGIPNSNARNSLLNVPKINTAVTRNMNLLRKQDYIKFVLADTDVKWFKELYPRIKNETLATITVGLFHHPENKLTYPKLMTLIQKMSGRISLNFQSHKMLWGKSDDSDI